MSRVITFSRVFPSYHPRAGEQTNFVQKVWKSLKKPDDGNGEYTIYYSLPHELKSGNWQFPIQWRDEWNDLKPKHHTIRAGHRWKVGDWFSPRVWSGKPYHSKQIQFAPDIQVKKVWDFDIAGHDGKFFIDGSPFTSKGMLLFELANNDGLTGEDFKAWFKHPKPFEGQIICWSDSINY